MFVDAALPDAPLATRLAPPGFAARLRDLDDPDGMLPRWTRWWPRQELSDVLPGGWFDELDEVLPRVPLAYVEGEVPVPAGWERGSCAYLVFGADGYAAELARARELGWSARILDGAGHLHCIVDADATAAAVLDLHGSLTG